MTRRARALPEAARRTRAGRRTRWPAAAPADRRAAVPPTPDRRAPRRLHAAGRADAGGPAAALALRAPAVVPEEVPVLRLQLARGARRRSRRCRSAATSMRWSPTSRRRCPSSGAGGCTRSSSAAARRACSRRRRSSGCWRRSAPGCRSSPAARSRSRPIPGTFERERFHAFRAAGVNRLSIGVQSFDDATPRRPRPRARRGPGAGRDRRGEGGVRDLQHRPDVRPARADAGRAARPTSRRRWRSRRRTSRSTS